MDSGAAGAVERPSPVETAVFAACRWPLVGACVGRAARDAAVASGCAAGGDQRWWGFERIDDGDQGPVA
jgi:hypothetical protein